MALRFGGTTTTPPEKKLRFGTKPVEEAPPVGPAEGTDEKSFFQRLFDVTNASTGESYLYGNNPKPDAFDDVTRIMRDTGTRGYADKFAGLAPRALGFGGENGAADFTANARERVPDPVEAAADISAALASSPYRVGSTFAGGVAGGLEGLASSYGHQKGWMPEWGNIAKDTVTGAALGSGAAKAGEWLGKGFNALRGKPPISTPDELFEAGDKAAKRKKPNKQNVDILARTRRMKAAEIANAEGPGGFKKILEGMDAPETEVERVFGNDRIKWPHEEHKAITKLANPPPPNVGRIGRTAGSALEGGGGWGKMFAGPLNLFAPLAKSVGERAKSQYAKANFDDLKNIILDSTGKLKTDKATINTLRNALAKTAPRVLAPRNKGER